MDDKTKKELENAGMSRIDTLDIEYWEKNLGKSGLISRLVAKAYRNGYRDCKENATTWEDAWNN